MVEAQHMNGMGGKTSTDGIFLELIHPVVTGLVDGLDFRYVGSCSGSLGSFGLNQAEVALVSVLPPADVSGTETTDGDFNDP